MSIRVLVSDNLAEEGLQILRNCPDIELDYRPGISEQELKQAIRGAEGIAIRSGTQLNAGVFEQADKLRAVVRAGVGVDNIDVVAATRRGIIVMNTPGGNTVSTAEHTVAMMMALARNIPQANESMHGGKWERKSFTGSQLAGKTLGLVGLGRVGLAVAQRAQGLQMEVIGFDPFFSSDRAAELGIHFTPQLDDLWTRADFISVHTPLTPETRNLISTAEFDSMRDGVRILNCARGGIVDETALIAALESGKVAGAAVDVFVDEPPGEHPLLRLPNVIATPHLGASTTEAQVNVAIEAARLLVDYLTSGKIGFAVNMARYDKAELEDMKLYLDMAYRLGLLQAQMAKGSVRRITVHYRGDIANRNTKLTTAAFAAGFLQSALSQDVNLVNAEMLAKERGIEIVEQLSTQQGDFHAVIHSEVQTDRKSYDAAGAMFGRQFQRIVRLGAYHLDAYLDGVLLIFSHRDVPGMIGSIGTICGQHSVNIAAMNVGRDAPGGEAIAVLNLDSQPPDSAIQQILQLPNISSACVVTLPEAGALPPWLEAL